MKEQKEMERKRNLWREDHWVERDQNYETCDSKDYNMLRKGKWRGQRLGSQIPKRWTPWKIETTTRNNPGTKGNGMWETTTPKEKT